MLKKTIFSMIGLSICLSTVWGLEKSYNAPQSGIKQDVVLLENFAKIYDYLDKDNVRVKVKPGVYELDRRDFDPLVGFAGSNCYFDLTNVKLVADQPCNTIVALIGNDIVLEGLTIETLKSEERCRSGVGTLGINITGNRNMLLGVTVMIQNSYPYGYGSYFGIGKGSSVRLSKAAGLRVGPGDNTVVKDCKIVMHAFGHGIFIRGANNALIENTSVEGLLRQTDDILKESSGVAFDEGFLGAEDKLIRPGRITSLCEDGIRIYTDSGTVRNYGAPNDRPTGNVTVRNCTVNRMRRGICLALGGSGHVVENCTVTECGRVGYNIGTDTIVKNCKGDAKYCQLLDIASSGAKNSVVELEVLDSRARQGNSFENDPDLLAAIKGSGHKITIKPSSPEAVPLCMTIEIGGNVGWSDGSTSEPVARSIELVNKTAAWVLLHPAAKDCTIDSVGPVVDYGQKDNVVIDKKK